MLDLLNFFPLNISEIINTKLNNNIEKKLQEIRIRVNKPIILKLDNQDEFILNYTISDEEILKITQSICNNSIYSYQNEIINGYITISGGHRVGITGDVVMQDNKVINIKYISSLNFRIAKQVLNCSTGLLKYVIDLDNNTIFNTLIASPPGVGKTTILKDLVRKISDGIPEIGFKGIDVTVIDERGEISAMYKGNVQNNIGIRTDVLQNVIKPLGIKMAIRSMAPKVIVADEIGRLEDIDAINYAVSSGVKGIFTAHSLDFNTMILNKELNHLINMKLIDKIIFLDSKIKCKVKSVYSLNTSTHNYSSLKIQQNKQLYNEIA